MVDFLQNDTYSFDFEPLYLSEYKELGYDLGMYGNQLIKICRLMTISSPCANFEGILPRAKHHDIFDIRLGTSI